MEHTPQIRDNDEIDLAELFSNLWKKRLVVVLVALLGFTIGGIAFLVKWAATPSNVTSSAEVRFSFNGVQDARYPNGQPFSINDLVSSNVLNAVYQSQDIADYDISLRDFVDAVSITPSATNREFIEARFKSLLSQDLTTAEINELNSNYTRELQAASRRFARIMLSLPEAAIPAQKMNEIVTAIPEQWARESIDNYGVLDLVSVKPLDFDTSLLENYEYLVISRYLSDYLRSLQGIISNLNSDAVARLLTDKETGHTASTLANQLGDVQEYHLNVLSRMFSAASVAKDPENAKFYLLNELIARRDQLDEARRRAEVIDQAYRQYVAQESSKSILDQAGSRPSSAGSVQYGDEFLSKLMSLGDELSDAKFKQAMLNRSIEMKLQAESIESDIQNLERNYAMYSKQGSTELSKFTVERAEQEIAYSSEKLMEAKGAIERIVALRSSRILGQTSSLYALNSEPEISSGFVSQIKSLIKFSGLGLVAGLFLGLFLALVLAVVRKPKVA